MSDAPRRALAIGGLVFAECLVGALFVPAALEGFAEGRAGAALLLLAVVAAPVVALAATRARRPGLAWAVLGAGLLLGIPACTSITL